MTVLLISFCVLLAALAIKLTMRPSNFPPGPRGMPLLGYAPFMRKRKEPLVKIMQTLAKTYGPVTGFYLGPTQPFISVFGPEAVKEALQNNDLNGRPSGAILRTRTFGEKLGLMFVDGDFWQEQRRFTLRHLRDLGFGKTSIEGQMMEEINDLLSDITETANSNPEGVVDFKAIFTVSVINILWAIVGGKRYRRDDPAFKKLLDNVDQFVRDGNTVASVIPVPAFLIRLFPSIPRRLGLNTDVLISIQILIQETIEEHISTISKGDHPRDFIDVYLNEMEEQVQKKSPSTFSRKQLIGVVQDLFAAGSHTSSSTIGFGILYMIHFPKIQHKMSEELDNICGDSLPSLAHRSNLPYTEAVVHEIMRMASITPTAIPHCAMKDTQLQGFTIPKGSVLAISLDSALKDGTAWEDPENFLPERHLDQNGKLIKNDAFIPFGQGKHVCLGEPLARNTVFLFMASLVKTFEFKSVPNEPYPTTEPTAGLLASPQPFKAVVTSRTH